MTTAQGQWLARILAQEDRSRRGSSCLHFVEYTIWFLRNIGINRRPAAKSDSQNAGWEDCPCPSPVGHVDLANIVRCTYWHRSVEYEDLNVQILDTERGMCLFKTLRARQPCIQMLRLGSTLESVHLALAYRDTSRSANLFSIGGWRYSILRKPYFLSHSRRVLL
jgi:hypothetical protein